jgi:hypothetical protein
MRHVIVHIANFDWVALIASFGALAGSFFTWRAATEAKNSAGEVLKAEQAKTRPLLVVVEDHDGDRPAEFGFQIKNIAAGNAPAIDIEVLQPQKLEYYADQHFAEKYIPAGSSWWFGVANPNGVDADCVFDIEIAYKDICGNPFLSKSRYHRYGGDSDIERLSI